MKLSRAGEMVEVRLPEGASLLDAVRGPLGSRATLRGCDDGRCGTCRVLLDGSLVAACRVALADVRDGATVETYEDVADDPAATHAVAAFDQERPTRCKLCVAALGVAAVALARNRCAGRAAAIDDVLEGAFCQCTGRGSLRRALMTR